MLILLALFKLGYSWTLPLTSLTFYELKNSHRDIAN